MSTATEDWNARLVESLERWLLAPGYNAPKERARRKAATQELNDRFGMKAREAITTHPNAARYYEDLMHHWKEEEPVTEKMTLDRFAAEMKRIDAEVVAARDATMTKMNTETMDLFVQAIDAGLDVNMLLMIAITATREAPPPRMTLDTKALTDAIARRYGDKKPAEGPFQREPGEDLASAQRRRYSEPRTVPITPEGERRMEETNQRAADLMGTTVYPAGNHPMEAPYGGSQDLTEEDPYKHVADTLKATEPAQSYDTQVQAESPASSADNSAPSE